MKNSSNMKNRLKKKKNRRKKRKKQLKKKIFKYKKQLKIEKSQEKVNIALDTFSGSIFALSPQTREGRKTFGCCRDQTHVTQQADALPIKPWPLWHDGTKIKLPWPMAHTLADANIRT